MHELFENTISAFIDGYTSDNDLELLWREPVVKFADAGCPEITGLRRLVVSDHFMPEDFLPGATIVLSYFLPFKKSVADSNVKGRQASSWARAYIETNEMAVHINHHLVQKIEETGFRAAAPENIGMISGISS